MALPCNLILNTDSYKASHYLQYPPNTTYVSSYIESRGGQYNPVVFFGLQMFLKEYLSKPISLADIDEAETIFKHHGLPFNRQGWEYILARHNGYLPLEIEAIPEGMVLPFSNVMVQIINTDPQCYWLTSYIETALLRAIWYPTTVATHSWHCKSIIRRYLEETSDSLKELPFKLHDFGARGVSSFESAHLGGIAHLVNFAGTDTLSALLAAARYYHEPMAGYSIPAAEHSTICCWGKEHEKDAYSHILQIFSGEKKMVSVVSDSFDIWHAINNIWGQQLHEQVKNNLGILVIRPDSGEPAKIVTQTIELLMTRFGFKTNSKGFRLLPDNIRIIQGDSVNINSIADCLKSMKKRGISADNVTFGMGGALLQKFNRDTLEFAMKANAIERNGKWHDVFKDPITDHSKISKRGRLALIKDQTGIHTVRKEQVTSENLLQPVFRNGELLIDWNFKQIRALAESAHLLPEDRKS